MNFVLDLDGTLIDSFERHFSLLKSLLAEELPEKNFKKTFDRKTFFEYKRNGHNNYDFLVKKLGIDPPHAEKIQKRWIADIETPRLLNSDKLYPDALDFLQRIKSPENQIVFLTARARPDALARELRLLGLDVFPDLVRVVPADKTAALKEIVAGLKGETVMVGDTESDFLAAEKLGVKSYILNRGFRSEGFLTRLGVPQTYTNLAEVIDTIL